MTTKRKYSYLDVALEAMTPGGIDKLRKADPAPSKRTMRLAVKELVKRKAAVEAQRVEDLISEIYPSAPAGRQPPKPGESRTYKVQSDAYGSEYLRIPPSVLGVSKGDEAIADFEEGVITLKRGEK